MACKPGDPELSSMLETHIKVEGEKRLNNVVLCHSHACSGMHPDKHIMCTHAHIIVTMKNKDETFIY